MGKYNAAFVEALTDTVIEVLATLNFPIVTAKFWDGTPSPPGNEELEAKMRRTMMLNFRHDKSDRNK